MSAPTPPVVELREVRLEFDEKKVLDGVSLVVEPLDRLVIMGQSGSGKSTILRLILGILPPSAGSIFFRQFEISRLERRKLQKIRTQVGMVYQYSALLSSRNVRDNVALPLEELTRKTRVEIDKIVEELVESGTVKAEAQPVVIIVRETMTLPWPFVNLDYDNDDDDDEDEEDDD